MQSGHHGLLSWVLEKREKSLAKADPGAGGHHLRRPGRGGDLPGALPTAGRAAVAVLVDKEADMARVLYATRKAADNIMTILGG